MISVTLAEPIELEELEVTARRPPPGRGQSGEQSTQLSQELLNRLPLPDLDPNSIALLAAGVVATEVDSLTGRTRKEFGGRKSRPIPSMLRAAALPAVRS
ncbi:MAG: hypothetical protein ACT443_06360 [Gemmatimonadota bacterium]